MNSPSRQIDPDRQVPAYRQIVDELRALCIEVALPGGETLPAVRKLELVLEVHFNRIAQAYRALAQEGFLEIKYGVGAVSLDRVAKHPLCVAKRDASRTLRQRLREPVEEGRASGLSQRQIARELRELLGAVER